MLFLLSAPPLFFQVIAVVLGLVVGSFLTVCVYRIPNKESIVSPGSYCHVTRKPLPWYDNIPLLGFILLRGRSRFTQEKIPWRYPLLEALTAVGYLLSLNALAPNLGAVIFAWIFIPWALALIYIDIDHQLIFDGFTLGFLPIAILFATLGITPPLPVGNPLGRFLISLEGALVGVGLVMAIYFVWLWLRDQECWGMGDAKLLAVFGALYGPQHVLFILFLSAFAGLGFALGQWVYYALTKKEQTNVIPFGPSIVVAGLGYYFLPIQQWWLSSPSMQILDGLLSR